MQTGMLTHANLTNYTYNNVCTSLLCTYYDIATNALHYNVHKHVADSSPEFLPHIQLLVDSLQKWTIQMTPSIDSP